MYLDVITLDEAKTYLRVDDTLTEDDGQITSMIIAALMYVENYTNVHVVQKSKEYIVDCGTVRVYDYPINDVTGATDLDATKRSLYTIYSTSEDVDVLNGDIGYTDPTDVPDGLKIAALEIISGMYYQGENNSDKNGNIRLSAGTRVVLDSFKRFIL